MEILDVSDFEPKLEILKSLMKMRENPDIDLDQIYVTEDTIIRRLRIMNQLIFDQRILAIGDSDLTALSISIFGNPKEVVIADIDKRLTNLLFEANMDFNLPVRFLYHDMRIKIIEILMNQFTVVIMEPPHSIGGITVFISRAMECIQDGFEDQVFISVPNSGEIRKFFDDFCLQFNIIVMENHAQINQFDDTSKSNTDFLRLKFPKKKVLPIKGHWIEPFFSYEERAEIKEYKCICQEIVEIGHGKPFLTIDELRNHGHSCGQKDVFAYHSKVKLL